MSKLPVTNKAALDVFVLQYSFKYNYSNNLENVWQLFMKCTSAM